MGRQFNDQKKMVRQFNDQKKMGRQFNDQKEKDGKENNDLQDTSKKTNDRATRIPPKTASKLVCSGRVGSSCCTSGNFIFTICELKTISPNVVLYCSSYI